MLSVRIPIHLQNEALFGTYINTFFKIVTFGTIVNLTVYSSFQDYISSLMYIARRNSLLISEHCSRVLITAHSI